jgi:thiosulfate/3-mercaptopyruvate sulfurtransferase
MSRTLPALVTTEWLAEHLGADRLRLVDASCYLPTSGRDAAAEYLEGHLPGAAFFDLDASSDQASPLPHMLPDADAFARRMASLGLSDEDDLIVYDGSGINLSAARAWWMFRAFGHPRVALLDGGSGKWRREGRPLERGAAPPLAPGQFTARLNPDVVLDLAAVRSALGRGMIQIADMRSAGRFAGTEPEPRPGLRGGHIPGSRSLPVAELVGPDGTLLPPAQLRQRILAAGIDLTRPVVATCGSGTSACALIHALHLLGHERATLYDGAWTEWGGRRDTPVATGAADPTPTS